MILQPIQWYLAYSLSYRDLEKIMAERGFHVDHSTINRWVVHDAPLLEKEFHKKKKRPGDRWRMDETYLKIKGSWFYYYRAVDKQGNTIDFLLSKHRDKKAMLGFKSFRCAQATLKGIELVAMLKKGQQRYSSQSCATTTEQFYALAG